MTFLVPAKSHAVLESYSDQCIQIISYLFSIRQKNSANEGLKLLLCMVKPYTLHVAGPWAELVKSGWRNLLESREALWGRQAFCLPSSLCGPVWSLGLGAVCQSSCSLTICLCANVLAQFTCEADPIKWKDCPWQLRAFLIKEGHALEASGHSQITTDYQVPSNNLEFASKSQADRTEAGVVDVSLRPALVLQHSDFICDKYHIYQVIVSLGIQG